MKYTIIALSFFVSIVSAQAATGPAVFECQKVDEADQNITIEIEAARATLIGFWKAGARDAGKRVKSPRKGEIWYQGFEDFVDDGRPNSGFLFIPASTLKTGHGHMTLQNEYCEDSCSGRIFEYDCKRTNRGNL